MEDPKHIAAPRGVAGARELAAALLLFGPLLVCLAMGVTGRDLYLEPPWLNVLAHGLLLLVVPALWSAAFLGIPVDVEGPGERLVEANPLHAWDRTWWRGAVALPPLFLGLAALAGGTRNVMLAPETLSISGWRALLVMVAVFVLLVFYGTVLVQKRPISLSSWGLLIGNARAVGWAEMERAAPLPGGGSTFTCIVSGGARSSRSSWTRTRASAWPRPSTLMAYPWSPEGRPVSGRWPGWLWPKPLRSAEEESEHGGWA